MKRWPVPQDPQVYIDRYQKEIDELTIELEKEKKLPKERQKELSLKIRKARHNLRINLKKL